MDYVYIIFFLYVEQRILECFEIDEIAFIKSYLKEMTFLNIISICISVFIFLFIAIFIFFSISEFTEPIKDSSYRINNSFYFIRKYSLNSYRKYDTNLSKF